MSAYEGSKMQEADEGPCFACARTYPRGECRCSRPITTPIPIVQKPDTKPRSLHGDLVALIHRFRTEYASVGTMKYAKGSLRVVIDDNDGTFRLTVKQ